MDQRQDNSADWKFKANLFHTFFLHARRVLPLDETTIVRSQGMLILPLEEINGVESLS